MYHKLGDLKQRDLLSQSSGDQKFKIKTLARTTLQPESFRRLLPVLFPASGNVPAIFGVPWLEDA